MLVEVSELVAAYRTERGVVRAVDGISLAMRRGENLGIVGESGCGKSSLVRCVFRVFPRTFRIEKGEIWFQGRDLVALSEAEMRTVRWKKISFIPQSAMNALNPVLKVGEQVEEAILEHAPIDRRQAMVRVKDMFRLVGVDPERIHQYPHQFSGGMRQRINIAMALVLEPPLVIADEPTTALDVLVQDQIFLKLREMQERTGASLLLVTHDISLVAENCHRIAVMYAGKIVEYGDVRRALVEPFHPYTLGLKNAFPTLEGGEQALISIPGTPPSLVDPPHGCRFAPRCPFRTDVCWEEEPPLEEIETRHLVACHHVDHIEEMRAKASRPETWEAFS